MSQVLVVGSSGLLGRALMRRLASGAVGTSRSRDVEGSVVLDALDEEAVMRVAREVRPTIIVNLVAERRPTYWTDLKSLHATNVVTADNVAKAARMIGADLVHASTDYVFPSGGPHSTDALHRPTNAYGATKSEAETVIRRVHRDAMIIRMPVLYGSVVRPDECNLSELVRRLHLATGPVNLDTWAQRRPTHVDDVAETLACVIKSIEAWRQNTVHVSATGWYSQFEMGQIAAGLLELDPSILVPVSNDSPERPRIVDLELDDNTPFLDRYRSLEEGLAQLFESYVAT